jgi:hypothetical protein
MLTAPVLVPAVVGLKVTRMVQLAPATTPAPQVLVWEKSPLVLMLLMLSVALPVFLRVTLLALLLVPTLCEENVNEAGVRLTMGARTALPVRLTVWVAGLALSVMATVPFLVPATVGL